MTGMAREFDVVVSLKISKAEARDLHARAKYAGVSVSHYIRKAIQLAKFTGDNAAVFDGIHKAVRDAVDIAVQREILTKRKPG